MTQHHVLRMSEAEIST